MSPDEHPGVDTMARLWRPGALVTFVASLAPVALLSLAVWWYGQQAPDFPIQKLQLAGTAKAAMSVLGQTGGKVDQEAITSALAAIQADWWLVAAYVLSISCAASFGTTLFVSRKARLLARTAIPGVLIAGLCDVTENFALQDGLGRLRDSSPVGRADKAFEIAAQAATFKFCLLAVIVPLAAVSLITVWKRALGHWLPNRSTRAIRGEAEKVLVPWRTVDDKGHPWPEETSSSADAIKGKQRGKARHLYGGLVPQGRMKVPPGQLPPGRPDCEVGFCVSGGGIRSACFTLGILQELREHLVKARYLVSVSGGGYLVGAMQLALAGRGLTNSQGANPVVDASDVYGEGSMEEDHTRRHGDYLADGVGQWLVSLWHVLRGVLSSFVVISSSVFTLGLCLSYFYEAIPLIDRASLAQALKAPAETSDEAEQESLSSFEQKTEATQAGKTVEHSVSVSSKVSGEGSGSGNSADYPVPLVPIGSSLPWILGTAGLIWMIWLRLLITKFEWPYSWLRRPWWWFQRFLLMLSVALLLATAVMALFLYVLPALMWVATIPAESALGATEDLETPGKVGAGAGGTLLFTYLGALVAILGRGGKTAGGIFNRVRSVFGGGRPAGPRPSKVPGGLISRLVVWAVLLILLSANLLLLGVSAIKAVELDYQLRLAIPGILILIWWTVDQTWMSLHPFYRKRLASAFSVRRVRLEGGDIAARPYDFEVEATPLSSYGKPPADFPQVIFACAANLSGPHRTAPGRRAVSYTLSWDYIGGADVGWIPTDLAENVVSGPVRADLTVQTAMAISGAAFASAMGTQSQAYRRILAISNARLGTWLPNPTYFRSLAQDDPPWWMPNFPRIRRLSYFYREIVGSHPEDNRLLLITDGGHYDNLGLIELLRHKCRTVYCIDSGGDPPPFPQSLSEAVTQARAELGVKIEFKQEDINALLVGSGVPKDYPAALEPMLPRLSAKAVAIGTIEYPEAFKLECEEEKDRSEFGTIFFAKSLITPEMSGELYAYSAAKPSFPRDPTGDQWFTGAQFNAYQALGRFVGRQLKTAKDEKKKLEDESAARVKREKDEEVEEARVEAQRTRREESGQPET